MWRKIHLDEDKHDHQTIFKNPTDTFEDEVKQAKYVKICHFYVFPQTHKTFNSKLPLGYK